jgi:hypothetical protein
MQQHFTRKKGELFRANFVLLVVVSLLNGAGENI